MFFVFFFFLSFVFFFFMFVFFFFFFFFFCFFFFFFFFQAEDGIRDADVTGVQTCALPICCLDRHRGFLRTWPSVRYREWPPHSGTVPVTSGRFPGHLSGHPGHSRPGRPGYRASRTRAFPWCCSTRCCSRSAPAPRTE